MLKRWLTILISCAVIGCTAVVALAYGSRQSLYQTAVIDEPLVITVDNGMTLHHLLNQFEQQGIYTNSVLLKLALRFNRQLANIKAGTYEITPQQRLDSLLQTLNRGEEKQFSITLVEGLTYQQWLEQLNAQAFLSEPMDSSQLLEWVQANGLEGESIEGWLLPDTYAYTANSSVLQIIERSHAAMQSLLTDLWNARAFDLPYNTAYEALILASIIEKETGVAYERSHIAGVFVNRLETGMRLQTDPTVIYGIGAAFDGNLTRKHLRTPTPYNTYVIKGLPPTPIAMPSKAALIAAFNPKITDDLFFVAKGDGTHFFSATLEQHNRAVRQYQLGIDQGL